MSEKQRIIVINNRPGVSDKDALKLVSTVVDNGLISDDGKSYCYGTTFDTMLKGKRTKLYVYANRLPSGTHRFTIL